MRKVYGCVFVWFLVLLSSRYDGARAQVAFNACDDAIAEAKTLYDRGNFDEVFRLLKPCEANGFTTNGRVRAYELLSLTYMALDSFPRTAEYIQRILNLNPQYEPDFFASNKYKTLVGLIRDSQERVVQITSVSKKAESLLKVPATVVVLQEEDIRRRGYQDLEQVLHDIPGFDVIQGNGPGYSYFYQRGYRSISNDRTLMLIDGVEENDLASDNIPLSRQYPLSDIERIEIIYGPASTMYGANAFVGVINIVTKSFRDLPDNNKQSRIGVHFNGQARTGNWNTRLFDGVVTAKTNDVALSVTTRIFHSDEMDWSRYPEWNFAPRTEADYTDNRFVLSGTAAQNYLADDKAGLVLARKDLFGVQYGPDGKASEIRLTQAGRQKAATLDNRIFGATLNGQPVSYNDQTKDWFVRAKLEFKEFTLSYENWKTDEGAIGWYGNRSAIAAEGYPRWVTWNRNMSAIYRKYFSPRFQILNLTSYRLHEIDGKTNLVTYRGYYNGSFGASGTFGFRELALDSAARAIVTYQYRASNQLRNEMRFFWSPAYNVDVVSGLELRNGIIQGNYITSSKPIPSESGSVVNASQLLGGNSFRTFDMGVYSQVTYNPSVRLKLVGGVRVDNNRVRASGGYGTVANPRLAVVYGKEKFIVKAIYAEAFKDASFLQRYATTSTRLLNNPNLGPEKVRNLEMSAHWRPKKTVAVNVVAYRANYSNAIGLTQVSIGDNKTTGQFQGVGSRRIWGIQADATYRWDRLNLWGNATYTNPMDRVTGLRLSDIADYAFNLGAEYLVRTNFRAYASINHVGARRTGAGTSDSRNPIQRFDPYTVMNVNLLYQNIFNRFSIQLTANNLLNQEYFVPGIREADNTTYTTRFPQPRRMLSLGLIYNVSGRSNEPRF